MNVGQARFIILVMIIERCVASASKLVEPMINGTCAKNVYK